jgi:predicted O-methyltransferase YrrM
MGIEQAFTVEQQVARAKAENWAYRGDMATEDEVLQLIASLVRVAKREVCVETGTYHGHGAQMIAHALDMNERGHLWTVEANEVFFPYREHPRVTYVKGESLTWVTAGRTVKLMSGEEVTWEEAIERQLTVPDVGISQTFCPEAIDLAFVDCGEPEHRIEVFSAILEKMNEGGLVIVHDTHFYESDFLEQLCTRFGAPPAIHFPALNGVSVWRT